MYFNNYQYLKNKEIYIFILLICFSVLVRIPAILIFGDTGLENEWKDILINLSQHGEFTFRRFGDFALPSLYMPPLYPMYLYFFSFFNLEQQNYIFLILSSQIVLASISIVIFYKINKLFFSERISFYSSLLFSVFPLHIYACTQISSVSLQSFLSILFFYLLFQIVKKKNILSIFYFSITSGLLVLLRGEFIAILVLSLFYLFIFFRIKIKNIILILLITLITISPYLIRNIYTFNTITITKSFGYNLWKGNNPNSQVEGSKSIDIKIQEKLEKIPKDKFYQINRDNLFLEEAKKNIINEPGRYLVLYFKKLLSFLFIDINSSLSYYYNPLHYIPVLFIGIISFFGIFLSNKKSKELNYFIFIFIFTILLFSCFAILARYKMIILPIQIIFINVLIEWILKKKFRQ